MRARRGQGLLFDFALALMVFLLVWSYLDGRISAGLSDAGSQGGFGLSNFKAEQALGLLVKGKGSPADWESRDLNSLVFPGLAPRDRELSGQKLAAFSALASSDYGALKGKMGLGGYGFFFTLSGQPDMNAGVAPQSGAARSVVQRIVRYNGATATASLTVYAIGGN